MSDKPAASEANPAAPAKKRGKLLLVVIVVALLAAGGGGGFFFYRKSSAASPEAGAKAEKGKKKGARADQAEDEAAADGEEEPEAGEKGADADAPGRPSMKKVLQLSLPEDADVKHVIELQPFIVNLADADESRYLRVTVNLGMGEAGEEKPDAIFTTRVRNAMLAVMTNKTSKELLTVEGKTALRRELLRAAQAASEEPRVEAIYITDFIVQL